MSIIIENGQYLSYTKNPVAEGGVYHLYKESPLEINLFRTYPGITKHLLVPKSVNAVKSYLILKGSILWLDNEKPLGPGSMIILKYDSEPFVLKVLEETEILVQSYEDPTLEGTRIQNQSVHLALSKIQEKDQYTYEHCMSVTTYVEKIALKLGYKGLKLRNIIWAATYHDVGKVYIDDALLNKVSPFTEKEYEMIKTHVVQGKDLICNAFDEDVYKIVLQHHERLDGSGYPFGLKEIDILEEAKIIAICDSYHAMVGDRVYKKGKSRQAAIEELLALADSKYDKDLVHIAIEVFKEVDGF